MSDEWAFASPPTPWSEAFSDDVAFLFSKIGARANKLYAELLAPLDLRPNQVAVLQYLAASEGASQREIVSGLWIDAGSLVAMLDLFEERGLAERRRNPSDRRASAVHLTGRGCEQLAQALELSKEVERRLLGPLPPADRQRLHSLLRSITGLDGAGGGPVQDDPGAS